MENLKNYILIFIASVIAFSLLVSVARIYLNNSRKKGFEVGYKVVDRILSPAELSFYRALLLALDGKSTVFAKVRIADIVKPEAASRSEWFKAFNVISKKHFDFVLCDPKTAKIICVIELNDLSHNRVDRKKRDDLIENVCNAAHLTLITFDAKRSYVISDIKLKIESSITKVPYREKQGEYI